MSGRCWEIAFGSNIFIRGASYLGSLVSLTLSPNAIYIKITMDVGMSREWLRLVIFTSLKGVLDCGPREFTR